jgi:hypothetical protein
MANSDKFLAWTQWNKEHRPIPPMTNSQARFAEKLLNDPELEQMLSHPGDIETIFKSVQYYFKNKDDIKKETKQK